MVKDDLRGTMLPFLLVVLDRVQFLLTFNGRLHILYNLALDGLRLPGC